MPTIGYAVLPIVPSLKGAKKTITDELSGVGTQAGRQFGNDFSNAARSALAGLGQLVQASTLAVAALGAATAKAGINFNALEQRSRAALSTFLGGAQAANKQMDELNRLVQTSPFGKDIFIQAQQQLLGFGREASKVVPDLKAINDAVAATGGGNQQLQDLAFVMAQISAAGKITGQDLIQFGQRGVNAAQLIGDAMGKTGPEIRSAITAGTISADEALDALTEGMEAKFGGASDAVKQQWDGVTQRISAQIRNMGSMLVEPFISTEGGGAAVDWATKLGDILVAARKALEPIYTEVMTRLAPAFDRVSAFLDSIRAKLQTLGGGDVSALVDRFSQFAPVIAAASAAMLAFSGHMLAGIPILGNLLGGINPVVAALTALALASPEVRDALGSALSDIAAAVAPLLPIVLDLASSLADSLTPVITAAANALGPLAQIVTAVLTPALVVLQPILDAVAWTIGKIADVVGVVLSPLAVFANAMSGNATSTAIAAKAWDDAIDSAHGLISGVGDLTGTLDENTAAFTKNTQEAIANYLATHGLDNKSTSDTGEPSALVQLRQWGVDTHAVVEGILGDASAFQTATDQINSAMMNVAAQDAANSGLAAQLKAAGIGAKELIDAANGVPSAVSAFQAVVAAQFDATAGVQSNQDLMQQGTDLLAQITSDTAGYGGALEYLSGQQQAANAQQQAQIDSMIAQGDVMGEVNGKLQVNAEQWAALAPSLAASGESGEHLTARMSELGFVAGESTAALASAADAALAMGNSASASAAGVDVMSDALSAFVVNAERVRANVTSALTGFVDPVGAWDATVQRLNQRSGGGGGGGRSTTDPAVAAAQAALKAGKERAAETKKSAKSEKDAAVKAAKAIRDAIVERTDADVDSAKKAEKAARDRVSAAKKEADELRRLVNDAEKKAKDAQDRLEAAQFAKRAADVALESARAGLASAQTPEERASWERAVANALADQATAASDLAGAQQDAARATQDAASAKDASTKATAEQTDAENDYQTAQDESAKASEDASNRKKAADKAYQDAKDKADVRYQKSIDAVESMLKDLTDAQDEARESAKKMSEGVASAAGGMAQKVKPSFADYVNTLKDQVRNQQEWANNILSLIGKVPDSTLAMLVEAGPQLADAVALAAKAPQDQLDEFSKYFEKSTDEGVAAMRDVLIASIPTLSAQGASMGTETVAAIKREMESATSIAALQAIAKKYGIALQNEAGKTIVRFTASLDTEKVRRDIAALLQRDWTVPIIGDRSFGRFAEGGAVFGAGTGTSDSIPALLSNGEHVWTADEVRASGGHGAVAAMRRLAASGALRFAAGGPVGEQARAARVGGFTYIDQSTTYYPQVEPDSIARNRRLEEFAAFGGLS